MKDLCRSGDKALKRLLTFFLVILLFDAGCKKEEVFPSGPSEVGMFDLTLGRSWTYRWIFTTTDSSSKVINNLTDTIQVRIAATDDSLKNFKGLMRFEAQSIMHYRGTSRVWYQFAGDSLIEIAYNNAGSTPLVLPKRGATIGTDQKNSPLSLFPYSIQKLLKSKGMQDSTLFRDDIRIVYKFPLSNGRMWTSFILPFLQTREVKGSEVLERTGKKFTCAKIQTRLPMFSPNIEWFDYVAQEGLIERRITYDSLALTASDSPEIIGYGRANELLELMQ